VSFDHARWVGEAGRVTLGEIRWKAEPSTPQMDPTENLTYQTPTLNRNLGRSQISDLAYAQRDGMLPESQRRRIVTVQRALTDATGQVVGVVRAGVLSEY